MQQGLCLYGVSLWSGPAGSAGVLLLVLSVSRWPGWALSQMFRRLKCCRGTARKKPRFPTLFYGLQVRSPPQAVFMSNTIISSRRLSKGVPFLCLNLRKIKRNMFSGACFLYMMWAVQTTRPYWLCVVWVVYNIISSLLLDVYTLMICQVIFSPDCSVFWLVLLCRPAQTF